LKLWLQIARLRGDDYHNPGMLTLINPVERAEPFDHRDWVFEAKFDGFRVAADTIRGRLISRKGQRHQRFEEVLICCQRATSSMASWSRSTTPGSVYSSR
jgi:ATP-dependent DNA ligase